jgi:hypothetical protein
VKVGIEGVVKNAAHDKVIVMIDLEVVHTDWAGSQGHVGTELD